VPTAYWHQCADTGAGNLELPSSLRVVISGGEGALPERLVRRVIAESSETGAWARFERSELSFAEFCAALEDEFRAAVREELGEPVVLDYVRLNIDARRADGS